MPVSRMGTGSGLVIVGGFLAALFVIASVGTVLTLVGGPNPGPAAFRIAMTTQFVPWIFASIMVLRIRRKLLASGAEPH